jgi:ribosome-binding ATPase YchF (GTP1/OBG family)
MLIGLIGAPNKGKSTLFSALTTINVDIADYPFTTIEPNRGIAYATSKCPDTELNLKCNPHNSICINGTRLIPVEIMDVAGLVPGASIGKGMGNQFLNNIMEADALVQVIDASGKTDINGNRSEESDPVQEVKMVNEELIAWMSGILKKHAKKFISSKNGGQMLIELMAGFKISKTMVENALSASALPDSVSAWDDSDIASFATEILRISKPIIIAANKIDRASEENIKRIHEELKQFEVIECCAVVELALKKAAKEGIIHYVSGNRSFEIVKDANADKQAALDFMRNFLEIRSTGVQEIINTVVFKTLNNIIVYPVEDENKYTNHFGDVLPDAFLMPQGSTPLDLAKKIHTDIADNMLYAIDARKKMRISKDYILKNNDIIKIVSAAK